jgi:hypothetical protein
MSRNVRLRIKRQQQQAKANGARPLENLCQQQIDLQIRKISEAAAIASKDTGMQCTSCGTLENLRGHLNTSAGLFDIFYLCVDCCEALHGQTDSKREAIEMHRQQQGCRETLEWKVHHCEDDSQG